jgi:hypothetical protein
VQFTSYQEHIKSTEHVAMSKLTGQVHRMIDEEIGLLIGKAGPTRKPLRPRCKTVLPTTRVESSQDTKIVDVRISVSSIAMHSDEREAPSLHKYRSTSLRQHLTSIKGQKPREQSVEHSFKRSTAVETRSIRVVSPVKPTLQTTKRALASTPFMFNKKRKLAEAFPTA